MESDSDTPLAPDFIRFLFSSKPKFDCYFEVGNKSHGKSEKIGAVKLMLMAHSEVFRLQLEESALAEKGDIAVEDVLPDTFKAMLKYVYGHDTTSDLCFDVADNMLYVAEKYMIKTLKNKLACRLMKLLDTDNICSLLNNPVCYTHLELNSAIREILRFETGHVLESPQFLEVNSEGFLKILEQDGLAVPEVELWRAAIKWAKHRANTEDGKMLRQQISCLTNHLRFCSMTVNVVLEEVSTTKVLTSDEIIAVCQAIVKNEKPQDLPEICDEIVPRKLLHRTIKTHYEINFVADHNFFENNKEYTYTILTKNCSIELLPLVCHSKERTEIPERWTYNVECTTVITEITNPDMPSTTSDPPITATWSENVKYGVEFEIPLAVEGRNITLLPDTKYTVMIILKGNHMTHRYDGSPLIHDHDYMIVNINGTYERNWQSYGSYLPCNRIQFMAVNKEC